MNFKTVLLLALLVFSAGVVYADKDTRLNISMWEIVDQNVTYAKEFYLVEQREFCKISGYINISNPSADTVSDIELYFENTDHITNGTQINHVSGRNGTQINGTNPGDTFVVHIPELRGSEYSFFNYTINCSGSGGVEPPLDIETQYLNSETGFNRKVLAGHNFTAIKTITNSLWIKVNVSEINITMETLPVLWNETEFNFTFAQIHTTGDFANVDGPGSDDRTWNWIANGGTLEWNETVNISFDINAPWNVPTTATYPFLLETLKYEIDFLASNMTITDVKAKLAMEFSTDKEIISPQDNELNINATWLIGGEASVPLNVSYNLTQVSLWITTNLSPISYTGFNITYTPNTEINESTSWSQRTWKVNYTDGSDHVDARPPIVWIRPFYHLMEEYNQIVKSYLTTNGTDLYISYIYVVNGYWLRVNKSVINVDQDQYQIDVLVQNIGNAWTPEGLVVTVYDFIPSEFSAGGWTTPFDSTESVTGDDFNGTAYRWVIDLKEPYNSSLGPCNGPNAVDTVNCTWNMSYIVNGTGVYRVSDLYIVGLDPRKVDGAGSHEGIRIETLLSSQGSRETIFATVVGFLLTLNLLNLLLTKNIHDKIGGAA
ncbi:MAG TPA: hypothetical protein ENN46_03525 [Candidatus Woesearchaeota archaeon]|nr:hypothetical protein [Candidatus Woesearchaeota archaeon]